VTIRGNVQSPILVAGGAGFIGSTFVYLAAKAGRKLVVLDDLSTGHRAAVAAAEAVGDVRLVAGDVADGPLVEEIVAEHNIGAAVHFAARIEVGESVRDPAQFWDRNFVATLRFVDALRRAGVVRMVFSSTAAVYGVPAREPLDEAHPCAPVNPYGATKLAVEQMLASYDRAYQFRSARLRYFNAAGALPEAGLGERHDPETHLIPNVIAAALGQGGPLSVFGDDFPTRDGTCVRDYVHVADLADAHLRALDFLADRDESLTANLGTGNGASVREVIEAAAAVTGKPVPYAISGRREGDPPTLVAACAHARAALGWTPQRSDLRTIVEDAYRFFVARNTP